MKKIISALAIGAIVAGSAFADMTVGLNYRNGASLFKYTNKGADARIVEVLLRHSDDGLQEVVADDVLSEVALASASVACEER